MFVLLIAAILAADPADSGQAAAGSAIHLRLPDGFRPQAMIAADFNGDRVADIAVVGESKQLAGRYSARVATGDIDGDGFSDIAMSNTAANFVTIVRGSKSGPRVVERIDTMNGPHVLALADVTGDGRADLVVAADDSSDILIFPSR